MANEALQQGTKADENSLFIPGLGPIIPRQKTIMSAHFMPCRERFMHSGRREFFLPAAQKRGEYTYVTLFDSQQWGLNTSDPHVPANVAGLVPMPVSVESIVKNCIDNWAFMPISMMGIVRLGIMEIAGTTATEAEKAKADRFEDTACRAIVEQADRFHRGVEKGVITDLHRDALRRLDSESREWFRPIEPGKTKRSVVSGNRIQMAALADQGVNIVEYYAMYDLDPVDYEDEYVAYRPQLIEMAKKKLGLAPKKVA